MAWKIFSFILSICVLFGGYTRTSCISALKGNLHMLSSLCTRYREYKNLFTFSRSKHHSKHLFIQLITGYQSWALFFFYVQNFFSDCNLPFTVLFRFSMRIWICFMKNNFLVTNATKPLPDLILATVMIVLLSFTKQSETDLVQNACLKHII